MIYIKNLSKVFKTPKGPFTALDNIDLHIPKGAVYGIIGLSGAGKSTLIRCMNMLEKPTSGEILINGQNMTQLSGVALRKTRQKIGMIFQHFNLLESRTVAGNIAFPLEIADWPKHKIAERIQQLLPVVGLEDKANSYPAQLSGGQKQRVGIARALATNPSVLLCDEATSALDPQTTESILELLREINEKFNLTIVIITHEMKVIKEICTDVAVIDQAQIVEHGPIESVFINPQSNIAKDFIASVFPNKLSPQLLCELAQHSNSQIVTVNFLGSVASEPIISDLIQQYGITVNILHGNIDRLRSTLFGTLTLELQGNTESISQAHEYLKSRNLKVEVIK
ncbi:MAG: methionine ABC transporter ATP-binding protein [Peptococcaceae bacterium]|jgi:D-methionine transport system ATP-binding protein|nr:methionine ABC transporter ATP-binding protein [Peptococcaceae bacterium]